MVYNLHGDRAWEDTLEKGVGCGWLIGSLEGFPHFLLGYKIQVSKHLDEYEITQGHIALGSLSWNVVCRTALRVELHLPY